MRGDDQQQSGMFSYVSLEDRVPQDHPLRRVREMVDHLGHVLMENRNGLIVNAMVTQADGTAERDAALLMLYQQWRSRRQRRRTAPMTVGADKAGAARVNACRT